MNMRATVFSSVLVLTGHKVGAFVSRVGSLSNNRQHHERRWSTSSSVHVPPGSRLARRRQLRHNLCFMSEVVDDNAAKAGNGQGEGEGNGPWFRQQKAMLERACDAGRTYMRSAFGVDADR